MNSVELYFSGVLIDMEGCAWCNRFAALGLQLTRPKGDPTSTGLLLLHYILVLL